MDKLDAAHEASGGGDLTAKFSKSGSWMDSSSKALRSLRERLLTPAFDACAAAMDLSRWRLQCILYLRSSMSPLSPIENLQPAKSSPMHMTPVKLEVGEDVVIMDGVLVSDTESATYRNLSQTEVCCAWDENGVCRYDSKCKLNEVAGRDASNLSYPDLKKASSFSSTPEQRFDYIIVGGGTAGCPLAATLSQNYTVLLLERGGSPYGNSNVSYLRNFHISLLDDSPNSPSQPFISTDGVINARARVLGGGTCINAGFYSRASSSFMEAARWDRELANESYTWVERRIVYWPEIAPWQAALRDGLLDAGYLPFNGYSYDHLPGTKISGITFDKDGFRHTAADLLADGDPEKLTVLLHATVHKIVFSRRGRRRRPRAVGVVFKDENGGFHRANLWDAGRSEVILSAGAIGSPQLLLLSGIGPRKELEEKGIPVLLHNAHVGQEMADNPLNSIFMPTKEPVEQSLIQTVGIDAGFFVEASSGFSQSSDSIQWHHGIMSAEIGQLAAVPPKQRSFKAVKDYAGNKESLPLEVFQGGFILTKVDGPLSAGQLSLVDADPESTPAITFNYFSHPDDLQRCVQGIRTIAKVVQTKRFAELTVEDAYTVEKLMNISVAANINLIPKHTDDNTSVEQFCRDTVTTIWHYHGGCHVGKVVDKEYRVLGVAGLRVVDGSTFHGSPGTNPQATVLMMGRYVGAKMLRKRLGRAAGV